eukprot:EG_transcript_13305
MFFLIRWSSPLMTTGQVLGIQQLHSFGNNTTTPLSWRTSCSKTFFEHKRSNGNFDLRSKNSRHIPKLIHQSWSTAFKIPARFRSWILSWVDFHPQWCYVFWDDADNERLIETSFPQYLELYQDLSSGVARADFARYALLHRFGGLYADTDFECLRPFDNLRHHRAFFGSEPQIHAKLLENNANGFLCNALMASSPGHPFWLLLMANIHRAQKSGLPDDPVTLTGPRMLHSTYHSGADEVRGVVAFPEDYFYPEIAYWNLGNMRKACKSVSSWNEKECQALQSFPRGRYTNNTYAVHHWQCTWCRAHMDNGTFSIMDVVPPAQLVRPTDDGWLHPPAASQRVGGGKHNGAGA